MKSLILVISTAFAALVSPLRASGEAFLFTSFRGDGDGLHLAYSSDACDWTGLNRVFLKPEVGSKLLRDPHILRGPDGLFHMVWTCGWHDKGIGYATSKDLLEWSEQKYLPLMEDVEGTETCWAPEIYFDESIKGYIIVWSSAVPMMGRDGAQHRAYYSLTRDFNKFTKPKILFDPGFNNIDTTMVGFHGKYVIFFKETDDQPKHIWGSIRTAIADRPLGPYRLLPDAAVDKQRAEGPSPVVLGDKVLLYFDYYVENRYGAIESTDLKSWKDVTPNTAVADGQRHGSILKVPVEILNGLRAEEKPLIDSAPKPILGGFTADPSIRVFGDTYYIYPTTDKPHWNTTEFVAWSSKNLVDWKREGVILDVTKDLKWADLQAWAPDCVERDGKYYFYFCARGRIGVAVSNKPAGPFKDALGRPFIEKKGKVVTNTIDPCAFIDDDGQAYLYFGNGSKCQVFKLRKDMISVDGDPVEIPLREFREGIVVFKRNGKYYFMWSIDDARSPNYRVGWGISDSPFGPVKSPDKDFIVLQKNGAAVGTAHHGVVNVPGTDHWYVAYHRHAIPGGGGYKRQVCLARMEFNEDGSIKPMDPLVTPFAPGDKGEPVPGK